MNNAPSPTGPYAWWMSFPVGTRAGIRSGMVSTGWTLGTIAVTLYGAYTPTDGNVTLHGFLAWAPSHLFGVTVGVLAIAYRAHQGFNRAVNVTSTTIPNPEAK